MVAKHSSGNELSQRDFRMNELLRPQDTSVTRAGFLHYVRAGYMRLSTCRLLSRFERHWSDIHNWAGVDLHHCILPTMIPAAVKLVTTRLPSRRFPEEDSTNSLQGGRHR